jgi:hypothetical protein
MEVEELLKVIAKSDGTTLFTHTNDVLQVGLNLLQALPIPFEQKETVKEKIHYSCNPSRFG